jgi:hypothetical protein
MNAHSNAKADQLIADLKERRDAFQAQAKAGADAGEEAGQVAKARLELQWQRFETQVKIYFETNAQKVEQRQAAFRDVAAAQTKAWLAAAESLHAEATKVAVAHRSEVEAAVDEMKAKSAEACAQLQKLGQDGCQSWAAMSAALAESRKSFDRASQAAWDAVKRAQP